MHNHLIISNELTFLLILMSESNALLELGSVLWKCLDQSQSFTEASFPPDIRNRPLSPKSEKVLCK